MKAIITGINGTVAPYVAEQYKQDNYEVIPWDRNQVPTEEYSAAEEFILTTKPDILLHLALGSPLWAENCAKICNENGVKFVFISTVSVYDFSQKGPIDINVIPASTDDYGRYKLDCEEKILKVNPGSYIFRIGWQVGYDFNGNNMLNYFKKQLDEKGKLFLSSKWIPACSFIDDTAKEICRIASELPSGIYLVDSNKGISILDLAKQINKIRNYNWTIEKDDTFEYNNRLIDHRVKIINLEEKLKSLYK